MGYCGRCWTRLLLVCFRTLAKLWNTKFSVRRSLISSFTVQVVQIQGQSLTFTLTKRGHALLSFHRSGGLVGQMVQIGRSFFADVQTDDYELFEKQRVNLKARSEGDISCSQ